MPPEEWDGTEAARKLLSCIYRCTQASGFAFGAQQIIDILRGKATPKVEQFGHERLSTFGIGKELDAGQWRSVLRQLVMLRLIRVDHEHYNTLRLMPECKDVLNGQRRVNLRRQAERAEVKRVARRRVDTTRVAVRRPDRRAVAYSRRCADGVADIAREHGVPAYTVFHDKTLHEIARALPKSPVELRGVSGVGATKLERYGSALLEIVAANAS